MQSSQYNHAQSFLQGGGEMGAIIRAHNWSGTAIGHPDQWPQSLRTMLATVLRSPFPMLLFWGSDCLLFFNDAYRPSLGEGRDFTTLIGEHGKNCWPGHYDAEVQPLVQLILNGGEPVSDVDRLLVLQRNGQDEETYWTYSYSPVIGEEGTPAGVLVTCIETTEKIKAFDAVQESKIQMEFAVEAAELATWDLNPATGKFTANARLKEWFGLQPDDSIPLGLAIDVMAPADQERVAEAIRHSMEYESGGRYDTEYTIIHPITRKPRFVKAKGRAWFGEDKIAYRLNGTLQDITKQKDEELQNREGDLQFRNIVEQAPIATCLFVGEDMRVEVANDLMIEFWGKGRSVMGKPLVEGVPELKGQPFIDQLKHVYTTGETIKGNSSPAELIVNGVKSTYYYDYTYKAVRDADGKIFGVMDMAIDVTQQVLAQQQRDASERRLRTLIDSAPIAIGTFVGRDLVIENPNQPFIDVIGRGNDIVGKSLKKVMPELESQPFLQLLDSVLTTGEMYQAFGAKLLVQTPEGMRERYFDVTFSPIRDEYGEVTAVLDISIDVTEKEKVRRQVVDTEATLRDAVELSGLGTWDLNLHTEIMDVSARTQEWFGFPSLRPSLSDKMAVIATEGRDRVAAALRNASMPESDGAYDVEYTIIHPRSGRRRILHALGNVLLDDAGKPHTLRGTVQDITPQREREMELEGLVQQRTEELAAANEELKVTNEELTETNYELVRSNEELAQYAYVASHDLQEPLRKIRVFTGMLDERCTEDDHNTLLISKISQSAERMSLLIRDLLSFSRLLNTADSQQKEVDLNEVVTAVINDFELAIREQSARVEIGSLPVVQAIPLQMNQLFYNLLSNALKFTDPARSPRIEISSRKVSGAEVKHEMPQVLSSVVYYEIIVADNGIGFDTGYSEQIFEVFKRLHVKDRYPGSGIGLAICRRIVANHNGYLFARSVMGEGTGFHILLPETGNVS